MTLEELVRIRNQLADIVDNITVTNEIGSKISLVSPITDMLPSHSDYKSEIFSNFSLAANNVIAARESIKRLIQQLTIDIDVQSKSLSDFSSDFPVVETWLDEESIKAINGKISLYTSWQYPSMQLGCKDYRITNSMVCADPLYFVDNNEEYLTNIISNFNEVYQKRIRPYHPVNLDILPKNQFSCIACVDFFNYLSEANISIYLAKIFKLLRPGGGIIFTYNNCEFPSLARQAEHRSMSWTTKAKLIDISKSIGFTVKSAVDLNNNHTWYDYTSIIELSKPGVLTSIKQHQTLGQVGLK